MDGGCKTPAPNVPVSPFDDEDADVVVVSSDGDLFYLYRAILGKASPVFKSMFGLPQSPPPDGASDSNDIVNGLPAVHLTERTRTLELLFTHCYPLEHPELRTLDDVHAVLEAAIKYDMEVIAARARKAWPAAAALEPFRAFAVACLRRWEDEAGIAARLTLREPIWPLEPPLAPEFKVISADTIVRLIAYHRRCGAAASNCAKSTEWSTHVFDTAVCAHCRGNNVTRTQQNLRLSDWYTKFTRQAASALLAQPAGSIVQDSAFVTKTICDTYGAPPCETASHCLEKIKAVVTQFGEGVDQIIAEVCQHDLCYRVRCSSTHEDQA